MTLTSVQRDVVIDLMDTGAILRTHTQTFPPYAEYLNYGIPMRIQYRTFEALVKKGAITHKHSNCWVAA